MKINTLTIFLIVFMLCSNIFSQEKQNLSSISIPKELKESANAIIRLNKTIIDVESMDHLVVKQQRIVTVLNKLGKKHISAYKHYNNDTKITKLSAIIYDALGNKIKKYSKSDFQDVSAIDGGTLYSDSRVKFLEHTPTSYPYTVVFESEYKNSSTGFIPKWFPIENYNLAIEKSIYILNNPQNIPFRKREKNFDAFSIKNSSTDNNLNYSLTNQLAIRPEYYTLNFEELVPNMSISLDSFSLKGIKGNAKNWKEFGKWMYNELINGRNQLSPSTISKVKQLVKGINNSADKAKVIYEYVQNKTRYISVQVDIGGWEPIAANKVDEVGYGDCKGLTNYTKALLDAVGVKSHYSIVWAGNAKKNVSKDFSSMQGNHVILNIPNNGNDIWLECTSQTIPFGFLGDFTDDRNVLVITPEGGVIKRTPAYVNKDNLQLTKANVKLLSNGNISAHFERKSYGTQYNDKYHIENYTQKELNKYYKSNVWDYNNNLEVKNIQHINNKEKVEFTENIDIKIEKFATLRDSSYLFKLNIFNRITGIPKRYRNRQRPLEIERGFTDKDEFTFSLPQGYTLTSLPEEKKIANKFGIYSLSFEKIDDTTFKYKREFSLLKGIYPKEDYKAYSKFRKTVVKHDNLRIELIKQ
ncbi:Transglutaminase-like superfamily protein [Tenacibaculum mesophilum]|uniref:DUF3857 domain-containing protein n=1 Tax=Tenacibaculum mesophilum TaxID=104268 RepID=A0ABN5T5M6_9FLAO|nr:DUF3857 domain-containing protein [Tenacibaculum mesophilum]AZJ32672.1 DUF3857 domain-containing protein [Tenacibaculum mesophilum]QFS27923.1 DUF3857 domain-containing protein [Tenacibaculum mesophilum]SHF76858.1 Transglutaminase-like superfamily protein [Tenacibaculum mesophilum]